MNKIYCFSNAVGRGYGIAYVMGDDGHVLGSHLCSSEYYVPQDLGASEGCRLDRHAKYKKHFPEGYEMVFVHSSEVLTDIGLQEAFRLNQLLSEKEKSND